MSTLRDRCTPTQLQAHQVLDAVRAGMAPPQEMVDWALLVLGDLS